MQYITSGDFNKSYPFSEEDFNTDFETYLSSLAPSHKANGSIIQKPEWKVGDQWTYAVKHPGDKPLTTMTVVREDKFEGKESYVVRMENREIFHSKESLEPLIAMKDGKLTSKRYTSSHEFSWPLIIGKRWNNAYAWEDLATKDKRKIDHLMVVSEIGDVTVPAGTFLAARVQAFDSRSGRLMWEYWYSPTTKWLLKFRDYSKIAFKEERLSSFKID